MLDVQMICVGKLKEKYFVDASAEYIKRLNAYCKLTVTEISEITFLKEPSETEIFKALESEYQSMKIPPSSVVVAMCIEGKKMSSAELSSQIDKMTGRGISRIVFVIGGSNGLSPELKLRADLCLSMSDMTFPHHLARVMLLEQLYRAFNLLHGGHYHK